MRSVDDALRWVDTGTKMFLDAVAYEGDSALPGWSRKHLVSHVAANADALSNLVRWAATGVPTPMYSSPEARAAGIERGLTMPSADLDVWLRASAAELSTGLERLTPEQWAAEVVTAQGRTVPASEVPWLRAREVMVHAVDLVTGVTFADLPEDFLAALADEVVARRRTTGPGFLSDLTAWLTGRPSPIAPALPAWL